MADPGTKVTCSGRTLADQFHEVVAGISFDVEFGVNHVAQFAHVGVRDVARVGPRVDRDAIRPKRLDALGRFDHIGFRAAARVAQGGNFVHVDAEPCHTYL